MLGNIIGGFIVILVGVTLAPTIANEVAGARYVGGNTSVPTNITGASSTILGLTTLFYNLSIAATAIGIASQGLRNSGLM
jgi:xanthine/uracil permease